MTFHNALPAPHEFVQQLGEHLDRWLMDQHWFTGARHPCTRVRLTQSTLLHQGDPALVHGIVTVGHGATVEHYQLLLGLRSHHRLSHARIGSINGWEIYDALHDPQLNEIMLGLLASEAEFDQLRFSSGTTQPMSVAPGRLFNGPETSTAVVYGREYVLKVLRRLTPGDCPDLVVRQALHSVGNPHVVAPLGKIEGLLGGRRTTMACCTTFRCPPRAVGRWRSPAHVST